MAGASRNREEPSKDQVVKITDNSGLAINTISEVEFDSDNARKVQRWLVWTGVTLALILISLPVVKWVDYHATHVTSTNATVRAHLAEIGSRVTGLVKSVEVEAGDRVEENQPLVRLEDSHLRAALQEVKAELHGLERVLEVERMAIEHGGKQVAQQEREAKAKVNAALAQTSAAKIRAEQATRIYEVRRGLLAKGGAISGEDVRNAESSQRTAQALLAEAKANHVAAQSATEKASLTYGELELRQSRISILQSDVVRARARQRRAQAELEAARIDAPEQGAIVRRFVQPGGSVELGQPLVSMWLGNDVWVEAWIDEDDIGSVRVGAEATLHLQAFPDEKFSGVVASIGLVTDFELPETEVPQPRYSRMRGAPVVGVRIQIHEPTELLLPGLSAVVAIQRTNK